MAMTLLLSRMLRCALVRFLTSLPMISGAAKMAHAPICSAACSSVIPCTSLHTTSALACPAVPSKYCAATPKQRLQHSQAAMISIRSLLMLYSRCSIMGSCLRHQPHLDRLNDLSMPASHCLQAGQNIGYIQQLLTSLPMMSMSGSFHDPGPATSVKPLDLCEASAQNSTIVLRLCQVDWMSSQLRHRFAVQLQLRIRRLQSAQASLMLHQGVATDCLHPAHASCPCSLPGLSRCCVIQLTFLSFPSTQCHERRWCPHLVASLDRVWQVCWPGAAIHHDSIGLVEGLS